MTKCIKKDCYICNSLYDSHEDLFFDNTSIDYSNSKKMKIVQEFLEQNIPTTGDYSRGYIDAIGDLNFWLQYDRTKNK